MGRNHAGRHQEEDRNEQGMGFDWMRSAETIPYLATAGQDSEDPAKANPIAFLTGFWPFLGHGRYLAHQKHASPAANPLKTP